MKVFLGSSSESTGIMHKVAEWIEGAKHEVLQWNDDDMFPAGKTIIERLEEITREVQCAAFIFSRDDKINFDSENNAWVPRDNVIFEYGLFVGCLGRPNVAVCVENDPKAPSDVDGIVYIDVSEAKIRAGRNRFQKWLDAVDRTCTNIQKASDSKSEAILPSPTSVIQRAKMISVEEETVLSILLEKGKRDNFSMSASSIIEAFGRGATADIEGEAEIAICKLIKRGFLEIEFSKIRVCSISPLGWKWLALHGDNNVLEPQE